MQEGFLGAVVGGLIVGAFALITAFLQRSHERALTTFEHKLVKLEKNQ